MIYIYIYIYIIYMYMIYIYMKWSLSVLSDSLWPMDCSLPGSSICGIFQEKILEWVVISFSRGTSQSRDQTQVSHIVGRHFTVWATREDLRILKWFAIPFSSGPHLVRTLHHDLSILVALHGMGHSFIELDKASVHMIRLVSFLRLRFSICLPSDGEG